MKRRLFGIAGVLVVLLALGLILAGCDTDTGSDSTGGNNTGGSSTGGNDTGGDNTGGDNTGGDNTGGDDTDGDNTGGDNTGGDNTGGDNTGGGTTTVYRIDQAIFTTCSKSGNNLVFNWKLTTTGKSANGLYTYTSPSSIVVSVQADGGYTDLATLSGSTRTYTLNSFASWAADDRVYFRVKCVSTYNETISYNVYRPSVNVFTPNYPK
jgi:hypothetical protein